MPAAFAPVASWIGTALWSATWVTVAKVAFVVGSAVYSRNQAKKAKRAFASLRDQGTTATFADPTAPVKIVYGSCRIGGTTVFAHTTGDKNKYLHQVIVLTGHDLSEIDDIYFGDEALGMPWNGGSPSNVPDAGSRYSGFVRINRKVSGGAADSELVSESGGTWTTSDKLTQLTSLYVRTLWDTDVFPQGSNFNISVDVKGRECYDPRDTSTAFTSNPALILRDYLVTFLGVSTSEIDDDDVIAAANICDESVTIADATTQARYTFNGVLDTSEPPPDNRAKIARSMAGWCAKIGGKWRMSAGATKSSSWSMTMDDLRGAIQIQNNDEISQACNAVRGVYLNPDNNWIPADAPLVRKLVTAPNITAGARCTIVSLGTTNFTSIGAASNTVGVTFTASGAGTGTGTVDPYLGEDNGVQYFRDIDLFGVINEATALRLMRIELERARHSFTIVVPCKMDALKVKAGDYVDFTESRYGWTNKLFEVVSHRTVMETQEAGIAIGCDLVLREVSSAIYTRTSADETTADPAPNSDKQNPWDVTAPVLGTLESDDAQLTIDSRGAIISRIKVPWTSPEPNEGTFEIEYKLSADVDWLPAPISPPKASDRVAWIGPVVDGEDYDVRIRAVNALGAHSDWDTETAHTVIGKSDAPAAPTSFTATTQPGGVLLEWVPPADLDIAGYEIYHAPTGDPIPTAPLFLVAAPAISFVVTGLTAGEDTDFWIKSIDTSGNKSTAVGPETAAAGATTSPTYMYHGVYSASDVYYHNDDVRSIVLHSSTYYRANNVAKDGTSTWLTPATDWEAITWIPSLAATDLLLAKDIVVTKKATFGDGSTANAGIITSAGSTSHTSGSGFHLNPRNSSYSNLATARFGDTSGYYIGFDGTNVETVLKTFTLKPSASGTQFVIDTDSSFVGPNPPARMTFGTMQALNTGTATALTFSTGSGSGVRWTGGTGFAIGNSFVSTYQIDTTTGNGQFADVTVGDDLTVTDRLYIGTTDCEFYRDSADVIRTPDSIQAQGFGAYGGIAAYAATSADAVFFASYLGGTCYVKAVPFHVYDSSNNSKFSVAHATGNTTIAGTLAVTGNFTNAATFNSTVTATGNIATSGSLTSGTTGTLFLGADCEISRTATNTMTTPDTFVALGLQTNGGDLLVYNGGDKLRVQASNGSILIQGTLVVTTRQTGWGAPTGTLSRASFDPSTVSATTAYQVLAALVTDLRTHGLIGN